MHIPQASIAEQVVLPFAEALASANDRQNPYDTEKWLYVPPCYGDYRYLLGTRGKRPLICIGINPSTAAPDDLDNTLKSVERIARGNGFDSWMMMNVYAQRATRPDDMDREVSPDLHRENMAAFEYLLQTAESPAAFWAAWGAIIEKRAYLPTCVRDMVAIGKRYGATWLKAGKVSKVGHPHHPLYLKADSPVEPFDIEEYLDVLDAMNAAERRK